MRDERTRLVVYNLYSAKRNVPKRRILLEMELPSAPFQNIDEQEIHTTSKKHSEVIDIVRLF